MSTQAIGTAVDFSVSGTSLEAKPGHGGHGFLGLLAILCSAIGTARAAEADYRKLVAHGVSPSEAANTAFTRN